MRIMRSRHKEVRVVNKSELKRFNDTSFTLHASRRLKNKQQTILGTRLACEDWSADLVVCCLKFHATLATDKFFV